ncbi:mitochondrial glutathione transporter SLC25A40-like isoform X2 [Dermatophagoides pteronyssinus]|uniref:mitochondrial glutathione transporter SLC25A40-like isoform X2 n=1 Tax=Dermatophagoides pteronyssinus TaxID=6956 RepID=UPI003F681BCA
MSTINKTKLSDVKITPVQQMISSCTGSFLTSILVTPLDVVKIRLQAQQKEFMKNKCFVYCNGLMDHVCYCLTNGGNNNNNNNSKFNDKQIHDLWYRRPNYFNGTMDGLIKIARHEGITSLWSGLPPTLIMAVPATVMYFTIYDQLRDRLRKKFQQQTQIDSLGNLLIPAMAGGSARMVAATVISPLEMIRTKMQSQKLSYHEIHLAIRKLIRSEGIFRLWNGLNATLLRDVPFSIIYWLNYENIKHFLLINVNNQIDVDDFDFGISFFSGAISGSIAATITLPFDVVKTHRQIELGNQLINDNNNSSKKTKDILKKIYQEHGYRGLFTGIVPRLIRVAPACAIMISSYEAGKNFFRRYNYSKMIEQQQQQQLESTSLTK